MEERRSFDYDGKVYFINTPTAEDIKQADWVYSKVYTKSLMEGIMTQSELTDILTRRGVIGPDYEKRRLELEEELSTKIMELAAAKTVEEKQIKALDVAQAREELFKWVQRLSGPMSNTCEQIADDSRLEYLTSCMVEYEDGTRVWKSYEEFLSEKDQNLALTARFQVMLYLQGMDSDFLENTPEALAMREIEEELSKSIEESDEDEVKEEEVETTSTNKNKKSKGKGKSKKDNA